MKFLNSVVVQDQAIVADGIYNFDLAVNPLSVVNIVLRPLNDTGTLANFQRYFGICAAINRVSIAFRGKSVFNMKGEDAAMLNYFRYGIMPYQGQLDNTNDERRAVVLPIILGKEPFNPDSCFPASRRGELTLELDLDIADTGYDGLRISVECIELLDAKPKEYERKVAISQTWAATGDQDMDLPPGNLCRGVLLFGTTPFAGATPAPSWGRIKVLLDNQEAHFAATDFEVAQMHHSLAGIPMHGYDGHYHTTTVDGNAQTAVATLDGWYNSGAELGPENWAFLDFDPTRDDLFSLDTKGASRFHLRANAETADAVRAIPVEVLKA